MNYKISLLSLILIFSCKNIETKKPESPVKFTKSDLAGTWKNILSQSPDFILLQDSAIFLQEDPKEKYPFDLNGDSLTFYFPKFNYTFKVSYFPGDSIHLMNEMTSSTFLRIR
ncbi:MAG: hypothetical protein HOP11_10970 [Saprospiraceae bacterium]|nr:hypothetical protein [Saprospiraceae bacterium]